ncbi:hypothetical protein NSA25_16090 [Erysipelatoclostridium ramosum]|uniref:lipopolysaccharide biosynthesis protein n=1 Tax=Thomasclavelia ramosa TaxID=1547 RepID=UPI00214C74D0|nr:hypothetical protein [Thomasclavelia ramosa]MCR1949354.1 hypothetical protein [Thomasclavelia ramosa]
MKNKLNIITSLLYQIVIIISGLIIPRLIISTFGSETNGLISSIKQLLSFISLFEGGIGAVILASLYKPIEEKNTLRISQIIYVSSKFFRKVSYFFIIYTIILSFAYPILINNNFEYLFIILLIFILSINTLMQYMFSVTNKLFLQADQKLYLVNIISTFSVLGNVILTVISIHINPNVLFVYLSSSIIYIIQPIIYSCYMKKTYKLIYKPHLENNIIPNTKSGFSQNLAHFINMNTDIIVITVLTSLSEVSVYSVYMLAFTALRSLISTITNSYQSVLGKYIAKNDLSNLKKIFEKFEVNIWVISIVLFSTCLQLINPFITLYTNGINDVNYIRPIFALLMILAQFMYCSRESYRMLILAAGKFKETNFGSYMEAFLNISISIILVFKLGLVGVAIGTLIAILYRLIYFILFLKKEIICLKTITFISMMVVSTIVFTINSIIYFNFKLNLI